jgi:hypothetical protein
MGICGGGTSGSEYRALGTWSGVGGRSMVVDADFKYAHFGVQSVVYNILKQKFDLFKL